MRSMTKVLTVAATLVLVLSLSAPLEASCTTLAFMTNTDVAGQTSFIVNTAFQNFGDGATTLAGTGPYGPYTFSYSSGTPAIPPLSSAASISFWRLGTGNTVIGMGDDNGVYDMIATGGFYFSGYYAGGGAYAEYSYLRGGKLAGTWQPGGIDGCVQAESCMCLLVSDQDGTSGDWASLGGMSDLNLNSFLDIGGTDAVANLAPILMVNIPAPTITGSARLGNMDIEIDVTVATSGGDYSQDGCACGPTGFKVLQQIITRGNMPPSDRSLSAWSAPTLAAGGAQPAAGTALGGTVKVVSACGTTNTDVYLTTQLIFDSGFGTSVVSGNSSRIECGPTLADPDDRPSRIRPRSDRPATPRRR